MSDDLVKRLRELAQAKHDDLSVGDEAAAEITRLRAELATARRKGMAKAADLCDDLPDHQGGICAIAIRIMIDEEDKKAAIRADAKEGKP